MLINFKNNYQYLLLFILIVVVHLPFLDADPHYFHSTGRAAFTDEGLYAAQSRNFVNNGSFLISSSDALIKTPLFGFSLVLPFTIFGISLAIARIWVLLLSAVLLIFFIGRKVNFKILLFCIPFVFLEYYIFEYSQFSMAEMLAISCVLAGLVFANNAIITKSSEQLFIGITFVSMSYFLKIQFIYTLAIAPIYLFLFWIFNKENKPENRKILLFSLLFTAIYLSFYLLFWYVPNYNLFNFVMQNQSEAKFIDINNWGNRAYELAVYYFLNPYNIIWSAIVLIVIIVGVFNFKKLTHSEFFGLISMLFIWLVFESHKFVLNYAPSRYFVAIFFVLGYLACLILMILFETKKFKTFTIIVSLVLLFGQFINYNKLINERTYGIKSINKYFANEKLENNLALGAWAATCTWNAKYNSMPIWDQYFNYKSPLTNLRPNLIIIEKNEEDCSLLFKNNHIDLNTVSDSTKNFRIGDWDLTAYWIKK
jgi:hypothetical protein